MKKTDELRRLVNRYVWDMPCEEVLQDIDRFLVIAMAKLPEIVIAELYDLGFTNEDFVHAMKNAPPGIFLYKNEWLQWNTRLQIKPELPFPILFPTTKAA